MLSNAQRVLAYRKELVDGGLSPDLVDDLTRDAAHQLVDQAGLTVMQDPSPASIVLTPTHDRHDGA